ncbi:30S ribosomal protein S2, partial [Bacillus sp. HC-Mk]
MKSLYSRFVFMTVGIMLLSSIIGFLLTNVYYQVKLKPYNSEKILKYAEEVKSLYEKQAQEAIKEEATRAGMYFVNQRWLGGT